MGSLRRGLILSLLPSAALAEVCDTERPDWDGLPTTTWDEAIILFSTLPALILIAATLLAWRFRSTWGGLAVVLLWSLLVTALISLAPQDIRQAAIAEGCRGDPAAFIGIVIVISLVTLVLTGPKRERPDPDTST